MTEVLKDRPWKPRRHPATSATILAMAVRNIVMVVHLDTSIPPSKCCPAQMGSSDCTRRGELRPRRTGEIHRQCGTGIWTAFDGKLPRRCLYLEGGDHPGPEFLYSYSLGINNLQRFYTARREAGTICWWQVNWQWHSAKGYENK